MNPIMRIASIIVLMCYFLTAAAAQVTDTNRDLIEWNEFYKLKWEDFLSKPGAGVSGDAGTSVYIKAKPYRVGKKVMYEVNAFFNRQKSWASDKSNELLSHEQLHFDIAELYARKIRKKVSELNKQNVEDLKTFNTAITKLLEESNEVDARYDIETLHGMLIKRQEEWKKKISEGLKSLQSYKKSKQIITSKKDV